VNPALAAFIINAHNQAVNDLVGVTRRLTIDQVVAGYRSGAFPMAVPEAGIISWHHPRERAVIPLDAVHVPRRLRRTLRQGRFEVTFDQAFVRVMRGCAAGRPVWIGREFFLVYGALHRRGQAHSVEVWREGKLVGGLYGVHLGGAFFAESKFHRATDASKIAVVHLAQHLRECQFRLLEVQYLTPHLAQFGTIVISDDEYMRRLQEALSVECSF
jgi:leucyl/phenylalanyl-tRNA--protein transferase